MCGCQRSNLRSQFLPFILLKKCVSSFCRSSGYLTPDLWDLYPCLISLGLGLYICTTSSRFYVGSRKRTQSSVHQACVISTCIVGHLLSPSCSFLTETEKHTSCAYSWGTMLCLIWVHMMLKSDCTRVSHKIEKMGELWLGRGRKGNKEEREINNIKDVWKGHRGKCFINLLKNKLYTYMFIHIHIFKYIPKYNVNDVISFGMIRLTLKAIHYLTTPQCQA